MDGWLDAVWTWTTAAATLAAAVSDQAWITATTLGPMRSVAVRPLHRRHLGLVVFEAVRARSTAERYVTFAEVEADCVDMT